MNLLKIFGTAAVVVTLALPVTASARNQPGEGGLCATAQPGLGNPNYNVIWGTDRNDRITGTSGPDIILGLAGNDRIDGLGGGDVICGGGGNDHLSGGDGNDVIAGERGVDHIDGGAGYDTCGDIVGLPDNGHHDNGQSHVTNCERLASGG